MINFYVFLSSFKQIQVNSGHGNEELDHLDLGEGGDFHTKSDGGDRRTFKGLKFAVLNLKWPMLELYWFLLGYLAGKKYDRNYSGTSISRTSTGNENWFEKSGVLTTGGKITVKASPRETTFGSRNRGFEKSRVREIEVS